MPRVLDRGSSQGQRPLRTRGVGRNRLGLELGRRARDGPRWVTEAGMRTRGVLQMAVLVWNG